MRALSKKKKEMVRRGLKQKRRFFFFSGRVARVFSAAGDGKQGKTSRTRSRCQNGSKHTPLAATATATAKQTARRHSSSSHHARTRRCVFPPPPPPRDKFLLAFPLLLPLLAADPPPPPQPVSDPLSFLCCLTEFRAVGRFDRRIDRWLGGYWVLGLGSAPRGCGLVGVHVCWWWWYPWFTSCLAPARGAAALTFGESRCPPIRWGGVVCMGILSFFVFVLGVWFGVKLGRIGV